VAKQAEAANFQQYACEFADASGAKRSSIFSLHLITHSSPLTLSIGLHLMRDAFIATREGHCSNFAPPPHLKMTAWRGWKENEVRQSNRTAERILVAPNASTATASVVSSYSTVSRLSPSPPRVMGFTPINAPRLSPLHDCLGAPPSEQRPGNVPTSPSNDRSGETKSIASEYLGRGDEEVSLSAAAQTKRVTRTPGRKRAATTNGARTKKRRKTSDISDSIPVAKPKQTKGKAKIKTAKKSYVNPPAEIADVSSCQPVSLFSSSTSMETLSAPSLPTSFDAAKASKFGTTLYHKSQGAENAPSSSFVSQPWLDSQANKTQAKTIKTISGAAIDCGQAGVKAVSDPQNRSPQGSPGRIATSRTLSEDLIPADGLDDDLALLDSIEGVAQRTLEMTPTSTSRASVLQSKPKKTTVVKTPRRCSTAAVDSSRKLSEDFLVGDDADMYEVLDRLPDSSVTAYVDTAQASLKRRNGSEMIQNKAAEYQKSAQLNKSNHDVNVGSAEEQGLAANRKDGPLENIPTALDVSEVQRPQTPLARQWELNMREVEENEEYGGGLFSEAEKKILGTIIQESCSFASYLSSCPIPVCRFTDASTDSLKANTDNAINPIVRTPFPRPILDRSPIFGASSGTMLRTCFRIGEALKEGITGIRSNNNILVELYARVKFSYRDGRKQHFVFHDLYHDRPPYLEGTCELWSQTIILELDTRSFLAAQKRPDGVMCRAIARMKRAESVEGKIKGWRLDVFSIWEARWEDIDFIEGIYGKKRDEVTADGF
jgi:hypothetical protein